MGSKDKVESNTIGVLTDAMRSPPAIVTRSGCNVLIYANLAVYTAPNTKRRVTEKVYCVLGTIVFAAMTKLLAPF